MGWGPLFFGYFLEFVLGINQTVAPFIHLLAYGFMCVGLGALERYCREFLKARICAIALLLLAVPRTLAGLMAVFPSLPFAALGGTVGEVLDLLNLALMVIFHVFLALAIKTLALRVSLKENAARAITNLILLGIYAALQLTVNLFPMEQLPAIVIGTAILLRLITGVVNGILLFSCYMHIQPAAGETKRAPSRFAFVNRFRKAFDEKEQKAIEADRAWHAENARKKYEKKVARMSQKERQRELERERRRKK